MEIQVTNVCVNQRGQAQRDRLCHLRAVRTGRADPGNRRRRDGAHSRGRRGLCTTHRRRRFRRRLW